MIDNFIRDLSKDLDLDQELQLINNSYTIPLEEDLSFNITPIESGFMLTATLAPLPTDNKDRFFEHILHGNLFGQGTRGAVLGLNDEGTLLTLSKIVDYNVDYKGFRETIEDFINIIDFWREEARLFK